jgi:hypothetical protein
MIKALLTIFVAVVLSVVAAAVVIHGTGPSTAELDADIASTKSEITAADGEAARYSGGLILARTQLRSAVLRNTLAMLEQKRESFLRGITLIYREPTQRTFAPDGSAIAYAELAKARDDAKAAHQEVTQYAGA